MKLAVAALAALAALAGVAAAADRPRDLAQAARRAVFDICDPAVGGALSLRPEDRPRLEAMGVGRMVLTKPGDLPDFPKPDGERAVLEFRQADGRAIIAVHGRTCWIGLEGRGAAAALDAVARDLSANGAGWRAVPMPDGHRAFTRPTQEPGVLRAVRLSGRPASDGEPRTEIVVMDGRETPPAP